MNEYFDELNKIFGDVQPLEPADGLLCSYQSIQDTKIQFEIASIKFYDNEDLYCTNIGGTLTCGCNDENYTSPQEAAYNQLVTNGTLSEIERNNYFPIIIGGIGSSACNNTCDLSADNIMKIGGTAGFDKYIYVKGLYKNRSKTLIIAKLLAHEFGHCFGLTHTWLESESVCDYKLYQCCQFGNTNGLSNNIMDYNPPFYSAYSIIDCQIGIMNYYVENFFKQYLKEDFCTKQNDVITINSNTTWENSVNLVYDVHVYGHLKIICEVNIAKNVNFIVHQGGTLEIDGGHLKACDEEWNGIIVEGIAGKPNNSMNGAGTLELKNGAVIENASLAISMDQRHRNGSTKYWGGYVIAHSPAPDPNGGPPRSATIKDCRRAVAFMKHGENGVTDESEFTNVTFENIRDTGVSIWANDGVDFIDCTFTNIANGNNVPGNQHEGIRAERAWVNVQDCTFEQQPFGVVLAVPSLLGVTQPSDVSSCDFRTDDIGIQLMNYDIINSEANTFDNNEFLTGDLGIEVIGQSPIAITNSDFSTDELGVFIQDGGLGYNNVVNGNDFMDNIERGCCFDGENDGLEFWANCFQGSAISDIDVPSGQVSSVQGNDDDEAGNRFTKGGIAEIRNSGVTSIDDHIWRNRSPGDEEYIDNSSGATDEEADNENVDECGAMFAPNPDPDGCAAYLGNITEILVLLQNLDDHLASAGGRMNEYKTIEQARVLKVDLFKQLISKVHEQSVEPRPEMSLSQLRSLIKAQPEFEIRTFAPSISLRQSNYRRARAELNALNTNSNEESNYVEAQLIYLDFLEAGRTEVSPLQLQFLRSAGAQQGKLNAYARTVLYLVSGERIPIVAPYAESRIDKRSKSAQSDRMITCHPNPVYQSGLFLRISESESKSYYYALSDMRGNSLINGAIESNEKQVLDTADLAPGVYLLIVRDALDEIIHHDKIVVMK